MKTSLAGSWLLLLTTVASAADPWADTVVQYTPGTGVESVFGTNPPVLFDQASAALGAPTRQSIAFGGFATSPYSPAADITEVVSIGEGGSLTVAFDEPVTDDPGNPFGIDLLLFGNAFFTTNDFLFDPSTTNTGSVNELAGIVELSADGVNYTTVTGLDADGFYPTNGYADAVGHFPAAGSLSTDFLYPVDPLFDPTGLTAAETYTGYGRSGGGAGIDLATLGLAQVSYVRITNPLGSGVTPEIDAVVDVASVPEPGAVWLCSLGLFARLGLRRR